MTKIEGKAIEVLLEGISKRLKVVQNNIRADMYALERGDKVTAGCILDEEIGFDGSVSIHAIPNGFASLQAIDALIEEINGVSSVWEES